MIKTTTLYKGLFFLMFPFLLLNLNSSYAQSVVLTTGLPSSASSGSGGNALISFSLTNNNSYDMEITAIDHYSNSGMSGSTLSLWYSETSISGTFTGVAAPTPMPAADWTLVTTGVITATSNSIVPAFTNMSLVIPANTTFRFVVRNETTTSIAYGGAGTIDNNFSSGGLVVGRGDYQINGQNVGYWNGTTTPRFWGGTIYAQRASDPAPNDAAVFSVDSPAIFCAGTQDVYATIGNEGINQINSVEVFWELNGVPQPRIRYSQLLDTIGGNNLSTAQILLGNHNFQAPTEIKVWTTMPNGVADTVNANDTITITVGPALQGNYTINPSLPISSTNYDNFTDLIDDLNTFGVCGPVVVDVANNSGPYNERLVFKDIPGTSSTNTIRINGNGNVVQYNSTSVADMPMLTFEGSKYVAVDNLTFRTLNSIYGWGAWIAREAEYDSIMNCHFDLTSITGASSINSNGIVFSSSSASATTAGNNGSHCYIANNHIEGGTGNGGPYYGVSIYGLSNIANGSDNNTFINNKIENFYYYGMRSYYAAGTQFIGNEVTRSGKTTSTIFYGIYLGYGPDGEIVGNRIYTPGGILGNTATFYGIYTLQSRDVLIANNAVYDINQGGDVYGIYMSTTANARLYHNTIDIAHTLNGTTPNHGVYATGTNTDMQVKNNNITLTGGGSASNYGFYYNTAASVTDVQKNNIYVSGTNNHYGFYTSAYFTQADFHAAYPFLEVNSPSVNPLYSFVSTGDLGINNPALIVAGENLLPDVPEDILGVSRSSTPTIGAFERPLTASDDAATLMFTSPVGSYCSGQQSVSVLIANSGINNIDSVEVHWEIAGVAQAPVKYYGTLVPVTDTNGISMDTMVLGNASFSNTATTELRAWTSMPNGVADTANINDTIVDHLQASVFVASLRSDTVCTGGVARLGLNPSIGYSLGDISWQRSTDSVNWVDIPNSDAVIYEDSMVLAPTWYRANIGGSTGCYSDTVKVEIEVVDIAAVHHGAVCDSGTVTLSAVPSDTGLTLNWYAGLTTDSILDTGAVFTTPFLTETDTFYVSASSGGGGDSLDIPNGTTCCVYPQMFTVEVKTDIVIDELAVWAGSAAGGTWDIYYRPDDYNKIPGGNTSSIGWTLVATNTVSAAIVNEYNTVGTGLNISASAGDTISFYVFPTGPTYNYHTVTSGAVITSNNDLTVMGGNRGGTLWSATTSGGGAPLQIKYSEGCESPRYPVIAAVHDQFAPSVDLGNDTTICIGSSVTLDAGNPGSSFLWNTGDTTQTIQVDSTALYTVTVTTACSMSSVARVRVWVVDTPKADSIAYTVSADDYTFSAAGELDVGDYHWDFGDNTTSTDASPTHTYDSSGTYEVTLVISNDCGTDTLKTTINHVLVGIDNKVAHSAELFLYPNPVREVLNLRTNGEVAMESIVVYNILGQNVYEVEVSESIHQLNVAHFNAGIYTMKVRFKDGSTTVRKFEVSK